MLPLREVIFQEKKVDEKRSIGPNGTRLDAHIRIRLIILPASKARLKSEYCEEDSRRYPLFRRRHGGRVNRARFSSTSSARGERRATFPPPSLDACYSLPVGRMAIFPRLRRSEDFLSISRRDRKAPQTPAAFARGVRSFSLDAHLIPRRLILDFLYVRRAKAMPRFR